MCLSVDWSWSAIFAACLEVKSGRDCGVWIADGGWLERLALESLLLSDGTEGRCYRLTTMVHVAARQQPAVLYLGRAGAVTAAGEWGMTKAVWWEGS